MKYRLSRATPPWHCFATGVYSLDHGKRAAPGQERNKSNQRAFYEVVRVEDASKRILSLRNSDAFFI
jgi:hypothetical protein